jgi:riboflavin kinase/FMN adenylyltransferase
MFDGIHVGHRMILENALRQARQHQAHSVVFSFANHPQVLISQTPTQLLSSLEERLAAFEAMGYTDALILDFTPELKNLSAADFVKTILVDHLAVRSVTVGYDHRFGAGRLGDGAFLTQCGQSYGFDTQIIDPVRVGDQIVSSTLIRKLLSYGDLEQANRLLGREYALEGPVEEGLQRGRQLGFPTANLAIPSQRLIPATGTYGGTAVVLGEAYPAVCNIGLSPTFGDQTAKRVEVHLLGYTGDAFYGESVRFYFSRRLRDERKFPSAEALIEQIRRDCAEVESEWKQDRDREDRIQNQTGHQKASDPTAGLSGEYSNPGMYTR